MKIRISFTGTSPLLMHNIQLADPDNSFTREIATYTAKRKKTEDDRRAIERMEWYGGLYVGASGPAMPTGNIRKALINAAKITKQGIVVQRALHFADLDVPLVYEGPRDIDALFKDPSHHHRAAVGIGNKRTMRVRPKFPNWAVVADAELLEDVLDVSDFIRVVDRAGLAEGLGDGRALGFGRFDGKVEEQ
ncbi:MAG: hypothetical protein ACRDQ7_15690 [Haloechinothrix sp.]